MTFPISFHRTSAAAALLVSLSISGCSSFQVPDALSLVRPKSQPAYVGIDGAYQAGTVEPQAIYNKVREARAQNSIVLQIIDDESPARVLPLPPGEKTVFVSDLLKQTGVLQKLGRVNAVLYRHSDQSIGGLRMEVKMDSTNRSIRPESDYALQAGDRLRVKKAPAPGFKDLITLGVGI